MLQYKAPLRDMRFLINEVLDYPQHYSTISNGADATPEMVDAILEGAATLCEEVLAPLNASGDKEGCQLKDGVVTTPTGFKDAYKQFVAGGWQGLSFPAEYGGQGLPMSLNLMKSEMMGAANWSFNMYPGLSIGCINTLLQYGTDAIKTVYLPRLVEGAWTGTMCLTEPQCGTDLAQVKTRAEPQADGTYALTGTKIFISAGDHDLADNIIHIVLARLPGAPAGTRGISLFVVPKFAVAADGTVGARNGVNTGSLEHKMGIAANATAVLNFDGAIGTLIGEPNKGLEAMFTFMNTARIGTAIQGVAHAELSFQGALPYAQERRSMRALSGKKEPEQVADALIWHPDVRRMLLTQKAIAEGGRAMIYGASKIADKMFTAVQEGDQANLGIQVFGGHGYIGEHGMEQIARDARISTLYEGTTGIQALDLLGRKVLLGTKGKCVRDFSGTILRMVKPYALQRTPMGQMMRTLARRTAQWNVLTTLIMLRASKDREQVGSSSVDYLMYSGFVMMAYFWALQASKVAELLASGKGKESNDFYTAKIQTAAFYFARLLPRADGHYSAALAPTSAVMQMPQELFQMA